MIGKTSALILRERFQPEKKFKYKLCITNLEQYKNSKSGNKKNSNKFSKENSVFFSSSIF